VILEMPSYRKRHREPVQDNQPAPPQPTSQAPVVDDPAGDAERAALRARIGELQAAERAQAQQQQPRPQLPPAVQAWIAQHPEFISDPERHLELQLAHTRLAKAGIGIDNPGYLSAIEQRLELNQSASPAVSGVFNQPDRPQPVVGADTAPSLPHQPVSGGDGAVPVSAPVSRSVQNWGNGRAFNSDSNRLSAAELEMARSLGLSPEEYLLQRQRMQLLKATGALQQ
jgi:hypothetical protein